MIKRFRGSPAEASYQVVVHFTIAVVALSALLPLVYVVGMSLTSQGELIARNYFVIIPNEPTIEAYRRLLSSKVLWNSVFISVFRTVVGPLVTIAFTVAGAYVLAKKDLPGRRILLTMVLVTILFRGGLIPSYLVMQQTGLLNTVWALILPLAVDSFGLLVIKMFIENIPTELTDAAQIDGVNEWQMMTRLIVPLAAPAIAAIAMFNIVTHWISWFDALVYLQDQSLYPLQLVLRNMLSSEAGSLNDQMLQSLADSQRIGPESLKMATVVVSIIPILMVYPFLQKHFIRGVYMGAVK
ncbi:carbohydrate ABC transporter permease [Occultella gossypii]|uniref:Carbohydrate ABC transporter permease n=1 Tax=Occultella gossypii TaxID=2800820 RepID=A0ABS7SJK6_9MICO|nr:carbohydrate ABC transporter permease [Occultella gossypii]MBZ2199526.1 carbohydrate ABC transporter permease [Occultella gossypii]